MRVLSLIALLALAACTGPRSGETVYIEPGIHMTTTHPAYTACGGPVEKLPAAGEWRCK